MNGLVSVAQLSLAKSGFLLQHTAVEVGNVKGIAGATIISRKSDSGIDIFFDKKIIHESFELKNRGVINDIALLHLNESVIFSEKTDIRAICLPPKNHFTNRTTASILFHEDKDEENDKVSFSLVDKINNTFCHGLLKENYLENVLFCAGHRRASSSCLKDTGGPFMESKNYRNYVTGIVSYECRCHSSYGLTVFTNVSYFVPWIEKQTNITSFNPMTEVKSNKVQ
ncbi:serine protease 14-like protein [Leptotrombidium deliense]|uniref:Serine protease 14-like protein n=1 Tax=Leptotrombidium deliense TaxID=299467 RepID=A0A443RZ55_9ACAR|nr:serine protease 14-like protein [Leptotrombidium deliense]